MAATVLLLGAPLPAGAECIFWQGSDAFVDIDRARVVFEGTVVSIAYSEPESCQPDRVVLTVRRVWKGDGAKTYTILQDPLTCPRNLDSTVFTSGGRYIVFATGPVDELRSMGCSTSRPPTKAERRRLDRWKKAQKSARGGG